MLQAGDSLAGYRIEAVAGVGGMGVVYRATQVSLDRPVALKVLSSTLVGNRTFRERFRREGRHAAALDHPNIIPVYEAGESNGLMFIAMRLVDGPSLADLIERRELGGREALRILKAVASALDAAHEAGLVHRDIKPQNMLLTRGRHPYLADFGITKGSDHGGLTHNGDFVGSLNYVAPEQIEGRDVGGASDIYSLTAVLFQALSGANPYQRDVDAALMHAHLTAAPPTFSERGIVAPAELDGVFARGMAKSPGDRFATGAELIAACEAALVGVDAATLAATPSFPVAGPDAADPELVPDTHPDRMAWSAPAEAPPPVTPPPVTPARPRPADATSADVRRPSLADAPAPPRERRRISPASLPVGLIALLVVAPILGYLLGHEDPPPAPIATRTAALGLTHDAGWQPAEAAIKGLTLEDAVSLRRADGTVLVAGRLPTFSPGFAPLPAAVQARLADPPKPASVRLGDRPMVRYEGALRSGEATWMAFAPDSRGWIAVACEGPTTAAVEGCPGIAGTVSVPGAEPVAIGPDARLAKPLAAALTSLGGARKTARTGLAAKSLSRRATAARQLAAVNRASAGAIAKLPARPQERHPITFLAHELQAQATALSALGEAAGRRDEHGYRVARQTVKTRERAIRDALGRLRGMGYGEQ